MLVIVLRIESMVALLPLAEFVEVVVAGVASYVAAVEFLVTFSQLGIMSKLTGVVNAPSN